MTGFVLFDRDRPQLLLEFPEVQASLANVLKAGMDQAEGVTLPTGQRTKGRFAPSTFGDMFPKEGQFGITSILPDPFAGIDSFDQTFTTTTPFWTDIFNNTIPEDQIYGIGGLAFDAPLIFNEVRVEIADTKFPRLNIEEAHTFERPSLLLKQGYVALPEKSVVVRGKTDGAQSSATQRVVPLGYMLFNRIDDVIIEE